MRNQTVQQLNGIFNARSVAVVGATSDPSKLGYMTLHSIVSGGYEGHIYPVNPKGGEILGLQVYRSLQEIPADLDLAIIIVPAKFVPGVLQEAVEKGVPGAVVLSAGFREAGRIDLEEKIVSIARKGGLRFVGPNVQGINYLPNRLCAMFFPVITRRGPLAVITQSGSATAALSEWAANEGLGISAAVNLGNQADLCESDYLEFFATDEHTSAIAMYIEGVEDGRRFLETLNRVGTKKPVVILKSGRSEVGKKAAQSHTGSLAGSHEVFCAACRQVGAITANSIETLFDKAKGLAAIRPPRGKRVMSISTSGGMGALAADEAEIEGLSLPSLSPEFVEELERQAISPLANMSNPLDLGYVDADSFRRAALLADQFNIADVILLNLGDPVPGAVEVAVGLASTIQASLAVSYLGGGEEEKVARVKMHEAGIAVFSSPERAMRGIGAALQAAQYRRHARPNLSFLPPLSVVKASRPEAVRSHFVLEPEAVDLIVSYGIPYPPHELARDSEEAVKIAERLGYPVVLKVVSHGVIHKTEAGGVVVGLNSAQQVRTAYQEIIKRVSSSVPDAAFEGMLVCKQIHDGQEVIVGAFDDPVFGPTVMFGLGGVFTEVIKDVTFRVAPLERIDAEEMIREIRAYPVLIGTRGHGPYDLEKLIDLLMGVSRILIEKPGIKELDLNPVRILDKGIMTLDVRLVVS